MTTPTPAVPPSIVEWDGDVYYNEVSDAVKQDVLKNAVVFTDEQIREAWTKSKLAHLQLISTNKKYRALPTKQWDAILELHLSVRKYVPEYFDCDSFAAALMGMIAFDFTINGIARVLDTSGQHSYNAVLVCDDGLTCSWKSVEPQLDKWIADLPRTVNVTGPGNHYPATAGFAVTA